MNNSTKNSSIKFPLIIAVLIIAVMTLVLALASCEKHPAETAGKAIDQAVENTGDKITVQTDKVGVAIDDTAITAKIKTAFLAQAGLAVFKISVDTKYGITTLSGNVDSQDNFDRASNIAGAIEGVRSVKNNLLIK